MMALIILLSTLLTCLILFLIYIALQPKKFTKRKLLLIISMFTLAIVSFFFFTGFKKIKADFSRIIKNSSPKSSNEVYALLFKKPIDNCLTTLNFKDQIIPKVDCCIWMEFRLCPPELARIIKLRHYQISVHSQSDAVNLLKPFSEKPIWWTPQLLGDTITQLSFRFNNNNQQTLFFGSDSTHAFLCDQAL